MINIPGMAKAKVKKKFKDEIKVVKVVTIFPPKFVFFIYHN